MLPASSPRFFLTPALGGASSEKSGREEANREVGVLGCPGLGREGLGARCCMEQPSGALVKRNVSFSLVKKSGVPPA